MWKFWVLMFVAIFFEASGTIFMKLSHGFTRLTPIVFMFICYGLGVTFMTIVLRRLDISIVYAIWSGVGTVFIAIVGFIFFKEPVTPIKVISIFLIVLGVIGLNLTLQAH